jgi:hypothetical protein
MKKQRKGGISATDADQPIIVTLDNVGITKPLNDGDRKAIVEAGSRQSDHRSIQRPVHFQSAKDPSVATVSALEDCLRMLSATWQNRTKRNTLNVKRYKWQIVRQ